MQLKAKLFFRSKLRIFLLAVLMLGTLRHPVRALYSILSQHLERFGQLISWVYATLVYQLGDFILIFILFLFLTFDYFREAANGNVSEILQADRRCFRHDLQCFLVPVIIVAAYTGLLLVFYIGGSAWYGILTGELFFYYIRLIGVYVFLNGLTAILAGWLFSRIDSRLIGYLCVIVFSVLVSPILTSTLSFFTMFYRGIYHLFRVFLIVPQGNQAISDFAVLFPMNLSLAARTLFWIGVFSAALALYYSRRKERRDGWIQWGVLGLGILCAAGSWVYSGLPASFYNWDDSLSATDALSYDQWHYVIDGTEQQSWENAFVVRAYEMDLKLRRQMEAEVTLYPEDTARPDYDMTLYHLYQVDAVTDQNGRPLPFERGEDYLKIENPSGHLEAICIQYHGGSARFYSNGTQVNLPGWLPYYPIPGWHAIYNGEEYQYYCNTLPYGVPFTVTIDAKTVVYSELDRVTGNQFTGVSSGPTFVAGMLREDCHEDGTRLVYPYLYESCHPESEYCREDYSKLLTYMREAGKKKVIITPIHSGDSTYIDQGDYIIEFSSWSVLVNEYEQTGGFSRIPPPEPTEERAIERFLTVYYLVYANDEYTDFMYYDSVLQDYMSTMAEWGYTEDDFEDFVIEHLGQEEWDRIKEMKQYDDD